MGLNFEQAWAALMELRESQRGQLLAEIGILLGNSEYIIAVEAKSKPKKADIANFEKRLSVLRRFKDKSQGKHKICGAITV